MIYASVRAEANDPVWVPACTLTAAEHDPADTAVIDGRTAALRGRHGVFARVRFSTARRIGLFRHERRRIILSIVLAAGSASAQTRTVADQSGMLAEWALTAEVTEETGSKQWTGPLTMKHVGFCSADGPEEEAGELRMTISEPPESIAATLTIEGVACTFNGKLSGTYDGVLRCPDRRDVPMMLSIQ
jgi:hypothetical protein